MRKPPKSVQTYMLEFVETEDETRAWLHVQRDIYNSIPASAVDLVGWTAFKMTTTRAGAAAALRWAGITET